MNEELKKAIYEAVKKTYPKVALSIDDIELEKPSNSKFGDLSTNIAMKIGKQQRENQFTIAENLVRRIQEDIDSRLRGNDRKGCGNDREGCGNDRKGCGNDRGSVSKNMKRVSSLVERIEAVKPGFINFYLSNGYWTTEVGEILSKGRKYADLSIGKGQKVQVEFLD